MTQNNLGIYIHIPFCSSKCKYCNFYSYKANDDEINDYVKKLLQEIENFDTDKIVDTIYFGGGTPTLIGAENILKIINKLSKFTLSKNIEISIETNPNVDINYSDLEVNRISFGLQSVHDNELKLLGRTHSYNAFLKSYNEASKRFNNINIDLMFGLPNQTTISWKNTYKTIKELSPAHISFYSLTLEKQIFDNLPNDDTNLKMYWDFINNFSEYHHYEISNIAKTSFECKHNLKYWNLEDYIGFGTGAHSYYNGKRFYNDENWQRVYEEAIPEEEYLFLGLRKLSGISKKDYKAKFNKDINQDIINKHVSFGTLSETKDNISLTKRGIEISNQVFIDFME